jgi:hypothetical protein
MTSNKKLLQINLKPIVGILMASATAFATIDGTHSITLINKHF